MQVNAATMRAGYVAAVNLRFTAAGIAADFERHGFGFDLRAFGNRAFGEHIQVHLHTVRNNAGKRPDFEPDNPDAGSVPRFGRAQRNIQNALCDRKFVHRRPPFPLAGS